MHDDTPTDLAALCLLDAILALVTIPGGLEHQIHTEAVLYHLILTGLVEAQAINPHPDAPR